MRGRRFLTRSCSECGVAHQVEIPRPSMAREPGHFAAARLAKARVGMCPRCQAKTNELIAHRRRSDKPACSMNDMPVSKITLRHDRDQARRRPARLVPLDRVGIS